MLRESQLSTRNMVNAVTEEFWKMVNDSVHDQALQFKSKSYRVYCILKYVLGIPVCCVMGYVLCNGMCIMGYVLGMCCVMGTGRCLAVVCSEVPLLQCQYTLSVLYVLNQKGKGGA